MEAAFTGQASTGSKAVDIHQFVQDHELESELDGVGKRLCARLVHPLAAVDLADKGNVENDAEEIEVDEELLRHTSLGRIVGKKHLEGGSDVEDRNGEFLKGEDDELDAFVDIVDVEKSAGVFLITAKGEDGGGDLEDAEVEDDHDQDRTEDAR